MHISRDETQKHHPKAILCFLMCFSLSVIGLFLAEYVLITHDMAAIVYYAQQMMRGRELYSDLFTSQFPFIFYLMWIPIWMEMYLGLSISLAFHLFVFLLQQVCILLSWSLIRKSAVCQTQGQQYALLFVLYYALFLLPFQGEPFISAFGQREVLFVALIMPYIMRCFLHMENVSVSRPVAVWVGVLASIGLGIKPHFVLIFMSSELYLMIRGRSLLTWNRIEVWIIGLFLLAYAAAMLLFFPTYFELIPKIVGNYKSYNIEPVYIATYAALSLIFPVALAYGARKSSRKNSILFLFVILLAAEGIFLLQRCGFIYQLFPALAFSLLILLYALLNSKKTWLAWITVPVFFCYVSLISGLPDIATYTKRREGMLNLASQLAPYKTIAFLSQDLVPEFPIVTYANMEIAIYPPAWEHVAAAYTDWRGTYKEPDYHTPEQMGENERYFHERNIRYLQQMPAIIMVDENPRHGFPKMKFNFLNYLMNDERFRDIWVQYELIGRNSEIWPYAIYRRKNVSG